MIDTGITYWNTIMRDAIGMTMKDIGFENAIIETLEDVGVF